MRAVLLIVALLSTSTCDAGHARARTRTSLRAARIAFRHDKLASGVTLNRAKTAYYRARTAANISGLLNPLSWLFGL